MEVNRGFRVLGDASAETAKSFVGSLISKREAPAREISRG